MMKRLFMFGLAAMLWAASTTAQVENRALKLTASGKVECGILPEMNGIHSYTVQLWLKPTTWKAGATVLERGDMRVALGSASGKLSVTVNGTEEEISAGAVAKGQWAQVTIINSKGRVKVRVNGQEAGAMRAADTGASMDAELTIGEGYTGLVDEIRIWNKALDNAYDYFWNNTLNEFNLQVDNLIAYYKMDHEEWTESLVDYKSLWANAKTNHHGVITGGEFVGVDKRSADQTHVNTLLPYLLNGAYTNNERFFDAGITREAYLMSNDIICLSVLSWNNGHLDYFTPVNHATLGGTAAWQSSKGSRKGVLSLDGEGWMTSPQGTLNNSSSYTIEGWLYPNEWTVGATILRKGDFKVSLGKRSTHELVINVGDEEFVYTTSITPKGWHSFGISASGTSFVVVADGATCTATSRGSSVSLPQTNAEVVWGEGFNGYMDQLTVWNRTFDAESMADHATNLPRPTLGGRAGSIMQSVNSLYEFADKDNPGWDSYSQDEWLKTMTSAFNGYRGYQFRLSVYSHTGWETTITDRQKRQYFADDLARLSGPYAGVELDLEWNYNDSWATYGDLIDQIRDALPADKTFMVSCHNVTWKFVPANRISKVDGFTMQQYGPQKAHYTYASCVNNYNNFKTRYPKEKIYLSYASTTSRGYNNSEQLTTAIAGVNWGAMPDSYVPGDDMERWDRPDGNHHYFMSPIQVYRRAKFCQDQACQGIFYWDMANDYRIGHKYMLSRMASYGLNANVDRIVKDGTPKNPSATGKNAVDPDQAIPTVTELKGERIKSPDRLTDGAYVALLAGDEFFEGKAWIGAGDRYVRSEDPEWAPATAIFRLDDAGDGCFWMYNMSSKKYIGHATSKSASGDYYEMVWCDGTDDSRVSRMKFSMVNASGTLYLPETSTWMFNMVDNNAAAYPSLKVGDNEPNFGYTGTNSWKVWLMYEFDRQTVGSAGLIDGIRAPRAEVFSGNYDLMGRMIIRPRQGIYVVNGKKVVVR